MVNVKRWLVGIIGAVMLITGLAKVLPPDVNPWFFIVVGGILVIVGWSPK